MPDHLVTIGAYSTPYEANLVRAELEAFDIDATLADDETIGVNWLWSNALGGAKLRIIHERTDAAGARQTTPIVNSNVLRLMRAA